MANLLKKHTHEQMHNHFLNPFLRFQKEFTHAMHDFYDLMDLQETGLKEKGQMHMMPAMDIVEDKLCYKLEIEMPGIDEADVKVSIQNNMLLIEAEKSCSRKDEKKSYLSREISYGHYVRSITLPQNANLDKVDASFKKGMLWINIPKLAIEKSVSKKINVKKAETKRA